MDLKAFSYINKDLIFLAIIFIALMIFSLRVSRKAENKAMIIN